MDLLLLALVAGALLALAVASVAAVVWIVLLRRPGPRSYGPAMQVRDAAAEAFDQIDKGN
jgi:hypothetical protein